jgi:hypothetical protein
MGAKQIRVGQLIAPFGPGSLYTDRRGTPHVVCGLDHWFQRWDHTVGLVQCDDPKEFERFEPRLAALLRVDRFRCPPPYRPRFVGEQPPPNAGLTVPALRFPRWYRHTKTGEMHRFNLDTMRVESPPGGGRWLPVRFVAICDGGHLCEFPWQNWIGCECQDCKLVLTDRGGSELSSIQVRCETCPDGSSGRKGKNLARTTQRPDPKQGEVSAFQQAGIPCPGDRPWLGENANDPSCGHPLVGALINQTNLYFPRTISAILLPDLEEEDSEIVQIRNEIENDPGACGFAKTLWNMADRKGAAAYLGSRLQERSPEKIEQALESLFTSSGSGVKGAPKPKSPEPELLSFRRAEFNIIRNLLNDPDRVPNLRVIPAKVPPAFDKWLAKVNLVERLRETRVFIGFDRLEQNRQPLTDMPDAAMRQLFRTPPLQPHERWLPAVEIFGEGLYFELREEAIVAWQVSNSVPLQDRLNDSFIARIEGVFQTLPPLGEDKRSWVSRYLLVHSLAHIIINQLVFECGYSTASLRERLYVSGDSAAPMAGFLIYTAAGDSEGTLGGLVRLGQPDLLGQLVNRALGRASWCSADPICSENLGGQGSRLSNLAACHACVLLPETSCETINQGLDRAMVVGTPMNRSAGFLAELLPNAYAL